LAFHNKGVQKHDIFFQKKSIWAHHKKFGLFSLRFFFSPSVVLLDFFYRVFGRSVTRGVQKRDKKNREFFSAAAKKSTHSLTYVTFFSRPPWRGQPRGSHKRAFAEPPLAPGLWNFVCAYGRVVQGAPWETKEEATWFCFGGRGNFRAIF
jgi:hypothetical protein